MRLFPSDQMSGAIGYECWSSVVNWENTDPHSKVLICNGEHTDDHRQLGEQLDKDIEISSPTPTFGLG